MARAMPKEAIAAESLQSRLDAGERFGQAQLLNLLRSVGDALADAHRDGRFHGTLTPADIRFDSAGEVELAGWERDTTPDVTRASGYAAIECYAPVHPQGPWTDVYALGAVLWHAITGEPPAEVLHRKGDVTLARLAPPGFDPDFLGHVDAALEIAPQRRPPSVEAWLARFGPPAPAAPARDDGAIDSGPPPVPEAPPAPPAPPDRIWRFGWHWPAFAGLFAGLGAVWLTFPPEPPTESVAPDTTPAPAPPPVTVEAAPEPAPAAAVAESPAAAVEPQAPPPSTQPTPSPTAAPAPLTVAKTAPPRATNPPPARVAIEAPPEPEPSVETGEAPRALLVRADKRLRDLFGDYARMRARLERSYDDSDVLYGVKLRAYRESRRIQRELVELREVRNRIARTGNFHTANRRYDELERTAAELSARMEAVRESL